MKPRTQKPPHMNIRTSYYNQLARKLFSFANVSAKSLEHLRSAYEELLKDVATDTYTRGRAFLLMSGVTETAAKEYVEEKEIKARLYTAFPYAVCKECAEMLMMEFEDTYEIAYH